MRNACLRMPQRTRRTVRFHVRILCVLSVLCGGVSNVAAQDAPKISLRPFAEITEERFAATQTFTGVFGNDVEPFYGGGVQVAFRDRYYLELGASRFTKTGDRVFRDTAGQVFHLGIPVTAALTPIELAGGYRFHPSRRGRRIVWLVPYVGAGVGSYHYQETSAFADTGENLDTSHVGAAVHGGAEFRVHRWIGLAADVQYTHVAGIFGAGGISADTGEKDLGGVAGRFRIIVGR